MTVFRGEITPGMAWFVLARHGFSRTSSHEYVRTVQNYDYEFCRASNVLGSALSEHQETQTFKLVTLLMPFSSMLMPNKESDSLMTASL